MENVAFRLLRYWFEEADLHLGNTHVDEKINIDFLPSGVYHKEKGLFELSFVFVAWAANNTPDNYTVKVKCKAEFQFKEILDIKDIPSFFYPNSIAILFPYVRAFVSTLTLQANVQPMLLPTINLSPLQEKLRNNTVVKLRSMIHLYQTVENKENPDDLEEYGPIYCKDNAWLGPGYKGGATIR